MITYNQIIELLRNVALAHRQIETFNAGQVWEIETELESNRRFPKLWAAPVSSTVRGNIVTNRFNLLCFDLVQKGGGNQDEVLSDTQQCLYDVIKVLKNHAGEQFDVTGNPQLLPFKESFGDWVSGWRAEVDIVTVFNEAGCDVPIDDFMIPESGDGLGPAFTWLRCDTLASCVTFQELEARVDALEVFAGVPTSRILSINGTSYDLSQDRSWTVGDVRTDSTYSDPTWLSALAWSKLTGVPQDLTDIAALAGSGLLKFDGTDWVFDTNTYATTSMLSGYQPIDADLTAIAALTGVSGLLRTDGVGGWTIDTSVYLTSYAETDPVFIASAAYGITGTQITNWDTAYGWGNHASAGYLTSFTETDPVFVASAAYGITNTNVSNWDTAYGWGNHASAGYQPGDADLTAIAALSTTGFARRTAANTWTAAAISHTDLGSGYTSGTMYLSYNGSTLTWTTVTGGTGFTVGTTTIASGASGRVLFESSGVLQESADFNWSTGNSRLGLGTSSPAARLNVMGASNDIAGGISIATTGFSTDWRIYASDTGAYSSGSSLFIGGNSSGKEFWVGGWGTGIANLFKSPTPSSGAIPIVAAGASGQSVDYFQIRTTTAASDGDIFAVSSLGKVGIMNSTPSALLTLGKAGTIAGTLSLAGGTSGVVTIQTAAAAGTYTLTLPTTDGNADEVLKTDGSGALSWTAQDKTVVFQLSASDLTTDLTTGAAKAYFRAPHAFTLTAVRASLATAQSSGSILTVDINENGTSVLSTKLTVDNSEKTSTTAATPAVISDSAIADDAEITIDIDQAGTGAKGLVVTLIGTR